MASIENPRLAVGVDYVHELAMISVTCDVEFTDVEINAMDLLGLRYSMQCQLFSKDLWRMDPVAIFDERSFPGLLEAHATPREHVVFADERPMGELHTRFVG